MSEQSGRGHLWLYDTLARTTRPFEPSSPVVKLYVCGVTPYDTAHLGHGFTYVAFDVLVRYLQFLGYTVRYVQNITDVDDPLFERAQQTGVSHVDLAREQTERYLEDMAALNVLRADAYPHASAEIPRMVELIDRLLEGGNAYDSGGRVYFSVRSDPHYGELSRLKRDGMIALAREMGGDPDDTRKRDPLDFLLWRESHAGEPSFESPWGPGLPGWHIECSAMSSEYLGLPIDIHGGGNDLIFPHHESEIAQSEAASGTRPFARYWMHTGMVHLGGAKMSKSLGNMIFVRDMIERWGANAVRIYLSSHAYRADLDYDEQRVVESADLAARLKAAVSLPHVDGPALDAAARRDEFMTSMNRDLDTGGALTAMEDLVHEIDGAWQEGLDVSAAQATLRELGAILGLRFT
jgi:L-cysteine:1D-myo-inositol 2-amino-2-deoxy-alpha-D-glucopyranoside ligase